MKLEIGLAGLVAIRGDDGNQHHLRSVHARVAFARLALDRDRGTTRDELADTVWPTVLPATWASALRTIVSQVRRFVAAALPAGTNPIVAQDGRYLLRLPSDVLIDVERAERAIVAAREALDAQEFRGALALATDGVRQLERGFLPECEGTWVDATREHYDDLLVVGYEMASTAAATVGDPARALVFANQAIARSPLRESAHRCRIAAHRVGGNRAEALRTYEHIRRTLAEELGVEPDPQTEAAYLDLLGLPPSVSTPV